jgi:hypothetical protein
MTDRALDVARAAVVRDHLAAENHRALDDASATCTGRALLGRLRGR